ncbi:MAG: UvrD-helicase domain-containing protein [Micrococcales bacterium]|nr:UvrD-helicase domain-containing protein [Micrococcales bacterium]
MAAGGSAAREAAYQRELAEEHDRAAAAARELVRRFNAGSLGERRVREALRPLESVGYRILEDRQWPGSSRANVDLVVIGRGGLFVVDAKNWAEVEVVGADGATRVYRGQEDVTDELARLADLADTIEARLAEHGVAPSVIHPLAVFSRNAGISGRVHTVELLSESDAVRRMLNAPTVLSHRLVDRLDAAARLVMPEHSTGPRPVAVVLPTPVRHLSPVEDAPVELLSREEVEAGFLAAHLAEPIEEWMTFLHPEQVAVVRRSYSGPSRIRGAAGTGKTVVGLHRAAYLARTRPGRVLVTTFVRTLPDVLRALLRRLAPDVVDRVDFLGVHEVAKTVLVGHGVRYRVDPEEADRAWATAWRESPAHPELAALESDHEYWRDEVRLVIKGRGITALAEYEDCARTGRRRALTQSQRGAVWGLFEDYDRELRRRQVWDFPDVVAGARACLTEAQDHRWSSVVVDEAQDLSAAMVGLLHDLVGDAPDGLTLIGDGQQSIYPGGYTLGELGISLAGRGVVMTRNYRNTVEIADFARELLRGDEFADIEGGRGSADVAELMRHGPVPALERFASRTAHDRAFAAHLHSLVERGIRAGDIGVLTRTNRDAENAAEYLKRMGIPTVLLTRWDGARIDAVKVGTTYRAKGLEFAQVALLRVPGRVLDEPDGSERRMLERRAVYVAATRARDGLWVGVV